MRMQASYRKEVRETEDYRLDTEEEMTEEELEAVSEAERKLVRYFMEHNPEKKVIVIRPGNDNAITLHGAQDVENFIEAIRDYSHKVF